MILFTDLRFFRLIWLDDRPGVAPDNERFAVDDVLMTQGSRYSQSRYAWALALALVVIAAAYLPKIVAQFPLENDVYSPKSDGEDWLDYHINALSVLNDGLSMPSVRGNYYRPSGFGYSYFIALVYGVAGVRSQAVYVVQAAMLVGGILGLFVAMRPHVSPWAGLALLVALAFTLYMDMFRALTFRLLSENLLFPLMAALLYFTMKAESTGRQWYAVVAGIACGLCFLARPNVLFFGPVTAALMLFAMPSQAWRWRLRAATWFLCAFVAVCSLMVIRNYAVTSELSLDAITRRSDWGVPGFPKHDIPPLSQRLQIAADGYARRLAFTAGVPQFMQSSFRVRPHWLLMWSGVGVYLFQLRRRTPALWEKMALVLCFFYFAPLIAIGNLSSYGVRMLAPGVPFALLLAVKGVDVALGQREDRRAERVD